MCGGCWKSTATALHECGGEHCMYCVVGARPGHGMGESEGADSSLHLGSRRSDNAAPGAQWLGELYKAQTVGRQCGS